MNAAPLFEAFSSVQGEATRVGEHHLFVRLAGCDLECTFCDTPASRRIPKKARLFFPTGVEEADNPLDRDTLDDLLVRLDQETGPHHAVSITGGEPLLFADYLKPLLDRWKRRGWTLLLETGGHRPDDLEKLIGRIDVVMADIKIASSAGFATDPETARRFLALASRTESAAKVVCSAATTKEEIESVAALVPDNMPLILQPVSGAAFGPPAGEWMLALQRAAMAVHESTRVIPQAHRALHLR